MVAEAEMSGKNDAERAKARTRRSHVELAAEAFRDAAQRQCVAPPPPHPSSVSLLLLSCCALTFMAD